MAGATYGGSDGGVFSRFLFDLLSLSKRNRKGQSGKCRPIGRERESADEKTVGRYFDDFYLKLIDLTDWDHTGRLNNCQQLSSTLCYSGDARGCGGREQRIRLRPQDDHQTSTKNMEPETP